jgi:hypothetical protein
LILQEILEASIVFWAKEWKLREKQRLHLKYTIDSSCWPEFSLTFSKYIHIAIIG